VLLLMTREDAAVYAGAFAAFVAWRQPIHRRRAAGTLALAVAWFAAAVFVAMPASRAADGLPAGSLLLDERLAAPADRPPVAVVATRLASADTLNTIGNLLTTTGFLPIAGATWLLPALPGMAVNMAAPPRTLQSSLLEHYAFPILPWLFMATAAGAAWLHGRQPRLAAIWLALLTIGTLADNPALRRLHNTGRAPDAAIVRQQLDGLTGAVILAQPNLIPHLPHSTGVYSFGAKTTPPATPDLVLITPIGNLWPLSRAEIDSAIAGYRRDPAFEEIRSGPLYAFRRR
jgi:hypothetical protein